MCGRRYGREYEQCLEDKTVLAESTISNDDPLLGQVLNERYEIIEAVHYGMASTIYRAVHSLMDRTVAIKVLAPHRLSDQRSIMRLQQEAQSASHLQHPSVVPVYDYSFIETGQPYLVMDYLDGFTLQQTVEREGPLSPLRFQMLFHHLCDGLVHAHQQGVIHRDLKPSHFVITRFDPDKYSSTMHKLSLKRGDELPVIVDFRLARLLPSSSKRQVRLTQAGEVIGTPLYMSPEHCLASEIDHRSDIYSLGCSMYYALTGAPPFHGESAVETMQMHLSRAPDASLLPSELSQIILKAMAKRPDERFQSIEELARTLGSFA